MKNKLRIVVNAALLTLAVASANAGVPPTTMVLPDMAWCKEKGYYYTETIQGRERDREDFEKAASDPEFVNVRAAVDQLLQQEGIKPPDAQQQEANDDLDDMLNEAFEGAETGAGIKGNAYDDLISNAGPDIILRVGWNNESMGFSTSTSFRIMAIDAYSSKAVASVTGQFSGGRGTAMVPQLKTEVAKRMPEFVKSLRDHFDDIQTNGREITVDIRIVDSNGLTFNSEMGGSDLGTIIYNWLNDNTVNNAFNERSSGRTLLRYNQVRIPFYDSAGRRMQAKQFVKQLQDYLKRYSVVSEERSAGLGRGRLYIGESN